MDKKRTRPPKNGQSLPGSPQDQAPDNGYTYSQRGATGLAALIAQAEAQAQRLAEESDRAAAILADLQAARVPASNLDYHPGKQGAQNG